MRPTASSNIEITEIDLDFSYNNAFIVLLNYMQYKLAFTRYIDIIAFKTKISY